MVVSLEEMKNYLRVDTSEDDNLISTLIQFAEKVCLAIARKMKKKSSEKTLKNIRWRFYMGLPIFMNIEKKPTIMS